MSARGIPVQDLPENQDPSVRFTRNEQTQVVTPWPVETGVLKEKPKRKGVKGQHAVKLDTELADVEESGDAGDEVPVEVAAMNVRELGS